MRQSKISYTNKHLEVEDELTCGSNQSFGRGRRTVCSVTIADRRSSLGDAKVRFYG